MWVRRARRLRSLPGAELRLLVRAQLALLRSQLHLWTAPRGRLVSQVDTGPSVPLTDPSEREAARRIALAVMRAAEHGVIRPACLVRALAIESLLHRAGLTGGKVRIGVRLVDGEFAAHAWVEYGDLLLGDSEWHVRRFVVLGDAPAPAGG